MLTSNNIKLPNFSADDDNKIIKYNFSGGSRALKKFKLSLIPKILITMS